MICPSPPASEIIIRSIREADLAAADHVTRVAFGTATGAPDPQLFFGDMNMVQNRWRIGGSTVFVAESDREIVASNVVTRWGSFGFFGPFGVRPDLWDRGIARRMMTAVMDQFDLWQVRLAGLYTIPNSPKHIGLYQQFGFKPQYLTAVMTKHLTVVPDPKSVSNVSIYADFSRTEHTRSLAECRSLTESIFEGLDVTLEIEAIEAGRLGDTLLLRNGNELSGFAACHLGPDTEAGSDTCYVKFAAASGGTGGEQTFENLLAACEAYAHGKGVSKLTAGVNTSRREAYDIMLGRGFRTDQLGVAMLKPDITGFNRPGVFVIDDWR